MYYFNVCDLHSIIFCLTNTMCRDFLCRASSNYCQPLLSALFVVTLTKQIMHKPPLFHPSRFAIISHICHIHEFQTLVFHSSRTFCDYNVSAMIYFLLPCSTSCLVQLMPTATITVMTTPMAILINTNQCRQLLFYYNVTTSFINFNGMFLATV